MAKLKKLNLLTNLFDTIQITQEVKRECVDAGKTKPYTDAYFIEKFIEEGKIKVHILSNESEKKSKKLSEMFKIDLGEAQSIILATEKNEKEILVDQTHAREAATFMELQPRGTIYILLRLVQKKKISKNECSQLLDALIASNFYISVKIYQKVLSFLKTLPNVDQKLRK